MENNKTALLPIQINKVDFSLLDEKTQYLCDHKQQGQGLHFPSAIKKYSRSFTHVYLPVLPLSKVGEVTDEHIEAILIKHLSNYYYIHDDKKGLLSELRSLLQPQPVNSEGKEYRMHLELEALIERFKDGKNRYRNKPLLNQVVNSLVRGGDPIDMLDVVLLNQEETFDKLLALHTTCTCQLRIPVSSEGKKEEEHSTTIIPGHENLNADRLYAPYKSVEQGEAKEPTEKMNPKVFIRKWLGNRDKQYDEHGRDEMMDDLYLVASFFRSSEVKEQVADAKIIELINLINSGLTIAKNGKIYDTPKLRIYNDGKESAFTQTLSDIKLIFPNEFLLFNNLSKEVKEQEKCKCKNGLECCSLCDKQTRKKFTMEDFEDGLTLAGLITGTEEDKKQKLALDYFEWLCKLAQDYKDYYQNHKQALLNGKWTEETFCSVYAKDWLKWNKPPVFSKVQKPDGYVWRGQFRVEKPNVIDSVLPEVRPVWFSPLPPSKV